MTEPNGALPTALQINLRLLAEFSHGALLIQRDLAGPGSILLPVTTVNETTTVVSL